jgi:hypothetical protein
MALSVWNRPAAKVSQSAFPLTPEQIATREAFVKALSEQIQDNIELLGGFITPGNDETKGTTMVALTLPMPGLTFANPNGEEMTTRPYNINVNAVIPIGEAAKQTGGPAPAALTWDEL